MQDRVIKLHELLKKKMQVLEADKRTLDEQATGNSCQAAENDKRQIESLLRERDLLSKNLLNADATVKKHADLAKQQLTHCEHLEKEVEGYLESLEQLKSEELRVAELQRSIGEQHAKLAAQKTLYEAVRSDRNLFSRNLIASLDEMTELKQ
ncbi:hypothetical protein ETH_00023970 [Eimeria tenella]|uniref:Cilia- and flagella-associated protein 58 central coiled coil domain-containing protein n=1 Tax=Eimeria tenella TaxID=5802 RepID=U6KSQ6_EIMTE|nr:hypothetical protein ETH_00023970 [Eimeria tenella]CDJ41162.1 hypothetical protein ETH_00023970 [Eimeria tenella]|eukprot:XP_013231912.1 hypothetical protein ETH_00023970 [Eimeria tenella]